MIWPSDAVATFGLEVEPLVKRQRPARGGSAGAGASPGAASDADVIDMGRDPPRWPWGSARAPAIGVAVVALAAGLVLGFLGGRAGGRPSRAPTVPAAVLPAGRAISATGSRCAVQLGHTLQLGIEIINQSGRTVVLRQIKPVLLLSGLHAIASQWGTCGLLPEPGVGQGTSLAPGATEWLTVTFDVMVRCPQPLPVGFKVSYVQAGRLATAELDSFPDLGQVHYNKCSVDPLGQ
jgi:hypothetical protein